MKDKYISFLPEGMVIYDGDKKEIIDMFEAKMLTADIKDEMEMC